MIQYDNTGSVVASQTLCRDRDLGIFFRTADGLVQSLRDAERMAALRHSVWAQRAEFTFDAHVDGLVAFFRDVVTACAAR